MPCANCRPKYFDFGPKHARHIAVKFGDHKVRPPYRILLNGQDVSQDTFAALEGPLSWGKVAMYVRFADGLHNCECGNGALSAVREGIVVITRQTPPIKLRAPGRNAAA